MQLKEQIGNFLGQFKKYLFTYNGGFFELPYLANSPQTLIATMSKMPFNQHVEKEQLIKTNNLFCSGELHYQELENGLWIIATSMMYKKNVSFNLMYDANPTDYYTLTFHINESPFSIDHPKMNAINFSNCSWSFLKPKAGNSTNYFKNSKGKYFNIFIHRDWLKQNIMESQTFQNSNLLQFINSDRTLYSSDHLATKSRALVLSIFDTIQNKSEEAFAKNFTLKSKSYEMISILLNDISISELNDYEGDVDKSDARIVAKTDRVLMDSLFGQFPGIEELAKSTAISATKLKSLYKQIHGATIFQFYQEKKMELAASLLRKEKYSIKEVAHQLGYENASKFSAAFKKFHCKTPSEYIK